MNHAKTKCGISDDLGLKSRVIQKPFQTTSATSTVASAPRIPAGFGLTVGNPYSRFIFCLDPTISLGNRRNPSINDSKTPHNSRARTSSCGTCTQQNRHTVPAGHNEPTDEHGRSLRRGFAAASRRNELPAGGDLAESSAEMFWSPAQSACETNDNSSSSNSEGSVAAGDGNSSTKSSPSSSCASPLLLLWERTPTEPSLSLLFSSLFSQALCAGNFELSRDI